MQGDGEHRVVAQLVESVVVISKLLDQHLPARRVQEILHTHVTLLADTVLLLISLTVTVALLILLTAKGGFIEFVMVSIYQEIGLVYLELNLGGP